MVATKHLAKTRTDSKCWMRIETPFIVGCECMEKMVDTPPRLAKASANKDCDDAGGVTFADWQKVGASRSGKTPRIG